MGAGRNRFSTTTRIRALSEQAAARVYRAQRRRLRRPVGRSRLTGRAALLALVVCSLVVALAYPLRQYVAQRAEINDQRQQVEEARERVEQLRDEKARWQDDAYVEQQARRHLHFVRPGETGFTLPQHPDRDADADVATRGHRDRDTEAEGRPWYEVLWGDLDRADQLP